MNLAEFLLARLAEDDQVARAAGEAGDPRWKMRDHESDNWMITDGKGDVVVYDEGDPHENEAIHIARHDPARVLAEVEAKRRIVDAFMRYDAESSDPCESCWAQGLGEALRLLALPYADHEQFKEEWRA